MSTKRFPSLLTFIIVIGSWLPWMFANKFIVGGWLIFPTMFSLFLPWLNRGDYILLRVCSRSFLITIILGLLLYLFGYQTVWGEYVCNTICMFVWNLTWSLSYYRILMAGSSEKNVIFSPTDRIVFNHVYVNRFKYLPDPFRAFLILLAANSLVGFWLTNNVLCSHVYFIIAQNSAFMFLLLGLKNLGQAWLRAFFSYTGICVIVCVGLNLLLQSKEIIPLDWQYWIKTAGWIENLIVLLCGLAVYTVYTIIQWMILLKKVLD